MTDNTQAELENLIRNNIHTFADEYLELDECVAALTDWHNKQVENYKGIIKMSDTYKFETGEVYYSEKAVNKKVEEVLDRLWHNSEVMNDDVNPVYGIPLSAIEAERNKMEAPKE